MIFFPARAPQEVDARQRGARRRGIPMQIEEGRQALVGWARWHAAALAHLDEIPSRA